MSRVQISVVPDVVDDIAKEINEYSKKYTYVITSGGIGPTHDDVTYEGMKKSDENTINNIAVRSQYASFITSHWAINCSAMLIAVGIVICRFSKSIQ